MVETSIFDDIPEELSHNLVQFSEAIDEIDKLINNYETPGANDRVMSALRRCRGMTETYHTTALLKCDKEATSRFIKHALWQSAHSKVKKRRSDNQEPSTSSKRQA